MNAALEWLENKMTQKQDAVAFNVPKTTNVIAGNVLNAQI